MALSKIQAESMNLADTYAFTGTVTGAGGENTPSFQARRITSAQSISASTWTKVQYNGESFDSDSCYDHTTNYRFTPNVAGKYYIYASVYTGQTNTHHYASLSFNGSRTTTGTVDISQGGHCYIANVFTFNGSTDYVEVETFQGTGAGNVDATGQNSLFGGYKLIGV